MVLSDILENTDLTQLVYWLANEESDTGQIILLHAHYS